MPKIGILCCENYNTLAPLWYVKGGYTGQRGGSIDPDVGVVFYVNYAGRDSNAWSKFASTSAGYAYRLSFNNSATYLSGGDNRYNAYSLRCLHQP